MGETIDNKDFVVKEDGTIVRDVSGMDKEIFDILEVGSCSHRIFASYDARKSAYKICKSQYKGANYKDYVEVLMRRNFSNEYEKAEIGKKIKREYITFLLLLLLFFFRGPGLIIILLYYLLIGIPYLKLLKKKHSLLCENKS